MGSPPIPVVRQMRGVVVARSGGGFEVNVSGALVPVTWPAGYIPTAGDAVMVLTLDGQAIVLGPVIDGQRPGEGTVSGSPVGGLVPVDTTSGTVEARYSGSAPGIGSVVLLDWQMTTPRVIPGVAAPTSGPSTPPTVPPPPPTTSSGTMSVTAIDSGTWSSRGVWDSYYGSHLTQGTWSGRTYTGAWFYGDAPRRLAGRTITAARLRLGARRRMGNYNSPLTLNLYLHGQSSRPAGDVGRIGSAWPVSIAAGAGPQWVDIPTSWATHIVTNGGGVGIAGGGTSGYGGITGIGGDPASGQLQIDWRA